MEHRGVSPASPTSAPPRRNALFDTRPEALATPQDGDVLVTQEPAGTYTIRQVPIAAQLRAKSRDGAMRIARRFAHKFRVDLWTSETGTMRLEEAGRKDTLARTRRQA